MIAHRSWHWTAAGLLLCTLAVVGVLFGTVPLRLGDVASAFGGSATASTREIVLTLRAPRVLLAALVGIALGASGAALQATLRNALAEPYLLGVSGGAAVGAVAGLVLRIPVALSPVAAFVGASIAVMLALGIAHGTRSASHADVRTMLMAGVVVGAFANAVIMIVLANVPLDTIRGALWWMMGSVGDASWRNVMWLAIYVAVGFSYLYWYGPEIDVLTLGEESAAALGVDVQRSTRRIFLASALLAAASVAAAGLVGFVGLIVPHIVRAAGVSRVRPLLLGTAVVGATLVIGADLIARVAIRPTELPLGAVTAVLGVPFFLLQLRRAR
ncbi:MAG: FecCD family ABC transporter permease [Gemmatimonadaceae bacterium]